MLDLQSTNQDGKIPQTVPLSVISSRYLQPTSSPVVIKRAARDFLPSPRPISYGSTASRRYKNPVLVGNFSDNIRTHVPLDSFLGLPANANDRLPVYWAIYIGPYVQWRPFVLIRRKCSVYGLYYLRRSGEKVCELQLRVSRTCD